MTTYFCDGLKEVTVVNGVVRLEFHRLDMLQHVFMVSGSAPAGHPGTTV